MEFTTRPPYVINLNPVKNYLRLREEQAGIIGITSNNFTMRVHAYNYTLRYNSTQASDFFLFIQERIGKKEHRLLRRGVDTTISINANNIVFISQFARTHNASFNRILKQCHLAATNFGSRRGAYVILHRTIWVEKPTQPKQLATRIIDIIQGINSIIDAAFRYRQVQFSNLNQDAFANVDPKSYLTQQQGKQLDNELKLILKHLGIKLNSGKTKS